MSRIISDNQLIKQSPIRKTRSGNKILRKNDGILPKNVICGEVVSIVGNQVEVEAVIENRVEIISCVPTGTVITSSNFSNLIAAGDVVQIARNDSGPSKIIKIENRATKLSRKNPSNRNNEQIIASNIDTLVVFVSTFDPMLNTRLIDRYLVASNLSDICPIIVVNKIELAKKYAIYDIMKPYKLLGIKIFYISALEDIGLIGLKKFLMKRNSVISGPSGVGKSTFLNKLLGYPAQVVRKISDRTNKGIHTTSFSRRYRLTKTSTIIDTPGLREFGIWDLDKDEIGVVFPDFISYFLRCKFTSCTHTHEPGCAVIEAVKNGMVDEERYLSYLSLYDTLE